jgi:serine/threonine-protein kinase
VWEGIDTLLDRRVAVKVLKEEFRTIPSFRARFRAEARHAGRLNHPGIAAVYDFGESDDTAYLVMELVDGRPLSQFAAEHAELSVKDKLSILAHSADALHAAHQAGVVHRDVKPGNLLVRPNGTVKVTDFGIARALTSAPLTDPGQTLGTPAYMSPEQATGEPITGASDVYSLGVVAYELFAGRLPFHADVPVAMAMAHVHDPPPPLPPTVPDGVARLVASALEKDPAHRPSTAAAFAAQLRRQLGSAPPPTVRDPSFVSPRTDAAAARQTIRSPAPQVTSTWAAQRRAGDRTNSAATAVTLFAVLVGALGVTLWLLAQDGPADDAAGDPAAPLETPVATPAVTDGPSATATPSTTAPPTTATPTSTPATSPPTTSPPTTSPPTTSPPTTSPPTTAPPTSVAAAPSPADPAVAGTAITGDEAVSFVLDYYQRLAAGDYETTWSSLSEEFRDDRDLTYASYVQYWEGTAIEIDDLRFEPGPGDAGRVRFDARYIQGGRSVEETDELTLRRLPDGRLIIVEQRVV